MLLKKAWLLNKHTLSPIQCYAHKRWAEGIWANFKFDMEFYKQLYANYRTFQSKYEILA